MFASVSSQLGANSRKKSFGKVWGHPKLWGMFGGIPGMPEPLGNVRGPGAIKNPKQVRCNSRNSRNSNNCNLELSTTYSKNPI